MELYDESTALDEYNNTLIIASSSSKTASKAKEEVFFDAEDMENDINSTSTVSVSTINFIEMCTKLKIKQSIKINIHCFQLATQLSKMMFESGSEVLNIIQ